MMPDLNDYLTQFAISVIESDAKMMDEYAKLADTEDRVEEARSYRKAAAMLRIKAQGVSERKTSAVEVSAKEAGLVN